MTNAVMQKEANIAAEIMSLEEFLNYDDGTDARYELEDGRLLFKPSDSNINQRIASFLFAYLMQLGLPFYRVRIGGTEVVTSGTRATVRLPDFMVLTEELAQAMEGASRSIVMPDMPPPQFVLEAVSPGRQNEERDYRYKRSQYEARGIAEYWIVDPIQQRVTVLTLVAGLYQDLRITAISGRGDSRIAPTFRFYRPICVSPVYEEAVFTGDAAIVSPLLSELGQESELTAAQLLQLEANQ